MRRATCKDCLREERANQLGLNVEDLPEDFAKEFVYNERAAEVKLERGQTRSDRCKRHRSRHRINVQGMAVPYIDLQTIGEAIGAHDANGPSGPFGGLGPMPEAHEIAENTEYDLNLAKVGMSDNDILAMLAKLKAKRVLIVKAGTGTGKSTFMPYRLLDPPVGAPFDLAALGPIIVTEPRVQATTGVAWYVGTVLSGAGGVGPGYPVGFQVGATRDAKKDAKRSGTKAHDESCRLIYVTDGTMINWLRDGRLSTIGTVIVDEAHERSTNIDFIMGYLKKAIDRYPHLRVIITSATFDERFYQEYYGGVAKVDTHVVEAVKAMKAIGYGFPLFPDLDSASPNGADLSQQWNQAVGPDLPLRQVTEPANDAFVIAHFEPFAPALGECDVAKDYSDPATGIGWREDLHETTRRLVPLRFEPGQYGVTAGSVDQWKKEWVRHAPRVLGEYVVDLVKGLDDAGIYGDVLGFLPTTKGIEQAVGIIEAGLGIRGEHDEADEPATVYPLISSLPIDMKEKALVAQVKGDRRKIVVSTNLAETSLTVEGVRFVVDSGLIAQDEWNPQTAQGGVKTTLHSQAGIRQRWGRVGRKSPGWAFPLYTKEQFLSLAPHTASGSTRSNLENLVLTAKLGGIDDVVDFDWPAKFWPATWPQTSTLDPADEGITGTAYEVSARSRQLFLDELQRADLALRSSGALDDSGDPTAFGKDLIHAPTLGSEASRIALMHADRLACVPEVATILKLLDNTSMVRHNGLLLSSRDWPAEWQLEAAERHGALSSGCSDDAELVLQVMAVWERCDPGCLPYWEPSAAREEWSRRWWVNHELLLKAAEARHEVLAALSPAMKEDVKRYVEPALVKRARGAITRAFASLEYRRATDGKYWPVAKDRANAVSGVIDNATLFPEVGTRIIPLKREKHDGKDDAYLSNIVTVEEWALADVVASTDELSAAIGSLDLVVSASRFAPADARRSALAQLQALWPAGMRVRLNLVMRGDDLVVNGDPLGSILPAKMPEEAAEESVDEEGGGLAQDEPAEVAEGDANPELDTSWPSPAASEVDESEIEAELQLKELAEDVDFSSACRTCDACRSGRLEECENPIAAGSPDRITTDLDTWLKAGWQNQEVAHPRVEVRDTPKPDSGWFDVVGYRVDGEGPTIRVRPAWREDDKEDRPGLHDDLRDGTAVELEVGPEVMGHHGASYRTFYHRMNGRRVGRFALRVASSSEALKVGNVVVGHVVKRMTGATATLTFVPDQRQLGLRLDLPRLSLDEAATKYPIGSAAKMVVTGVGENGGSAWLEAPDGTEARVMSKDVGVAGVFHMRGAVEVGQEVLAVVRDVKDHNGKAQLQVALPDVSLPTIADVAARYPIGTVVSMRVTGIAADGGRAWLVTSDGMGAMALRKDAGAGGLADLSSSIATGDDVEARVLSTGEPNGRIQIAVALPTVTGPTLAAALEQLPVGTRARFTVTRILPGGRRAFLKSSTGLSATVTANDVGRSGVLALSTVISVGEVIEAAVTGVEERDGEPQLRLGLQEMEVPSIQRQLEEFRVVRGEVHDGIIDSVAEFGLFVTVGPVNGLVHKSKLPGASTYGYAKGNPLRVVVVEAGEDPRRPGSPKVDLALA